MILLLLMLARLSPPTAEPVRVPYHLSPTKHILVRAKLNGHGPYSFILDSGAPSLFIRPETARDVGVTAGNDRWAILDELEVEGGAKATHLMIRVEEPPQVRRMNAMGLAGAQIEGVLGYSALARFKVTLDFTRPEMLWTPSATPPAQPRSLSELGAKMTANPLSGPGFERMADNATALLGRRQPPAPRLRGYVGIELADSPAGVKVVSVLPGSPAASAGIRAGDVITHAGAGAAAPAVVRSAAELLRRAAGAVPGSTMQFRLLRGKAALKATVRVGEGM